MYCIEIAFGHCQFNGSMLPRSQIALAEQMGLSILTKYFQGSYVHRSLGGYLTPENRVLIEPSSVIRSYAQEVDSHLNDLLELAREIATTLEQDCVLLCIFRLQGTMQWVEAETSVLDAKELVLTSPLTL